MKFAADGQAEIFMGWWVYLITDGAGHYKIGMSKDVPARLVQLQISNPRKLRVVAVALCGRQSDAADLEAGILFSCRRHKTSGEWIAAKSEAALLRTACLGWGHFMLRCEADVRARFDRLKEPMPKLPWKKIIEFLPRKL